MIERIKLNECTSEQVQKVLSAKTDVLFLAEEKFDIKLLELINEKCHSGVELSLNIDEEITTDLLRLVPNVCKITLWPDYDYPLDSLECLSGWKNLTYLSLGLYVNEKVSFAPINHITTLKEFNFIDKGLINRQYEFINRQKQLETLHIKTLDLSLMAALPALKDLYIHSTLKNADLLAEKFPNLQKFHLHGESRRENHEFIKDLSNIESIEINYNGHIKSFPQTKNPEKVKSITLLECPNFVDIDSFLPYENLQYLALTTHNKTLNIEFDEFCKLKKLKQLKSVYFVWGRKTIDEKEREKLYDEMGWKL